ncbi:PepSY domain-containing protein [Thalassospira sp.]|uniref:PepSY-associated TM helix domain-containing protein n=1 Tax=Thalassospira sp. TaxID=1912094 RepID=UPI002735ABF4|nr:PepSY domain-containing protein [Thalassospira sp.]MDP2698741.1 PepSY domain-containing protein [Thalassospira sp.]
MTGSSRSAPVLSRASGGIYRAVWRWHFYAGLFVLPFLILLAVTGGAYLFRDEIDNWVYADLKQVEPLDIAPLSMGAQVDAVRYFVGETPVKITTPATPEMATEIVIATSGGERRAVYVNPYTAEVLGSMPDRGTIMWLVRRIHSLAEFGTATNYIIEIVAGWTILLVATGIYLWWPRQDQKGGVVTLRDTPKRRSWWRDLHAVTGLFAGFFIMFLAITGMPWSVMWGKYANQFANGTPTGYPSGVRVDVPLSTVPMIDAFGETGWTTENAPIPQSVDQAATPIGIDAAIARMNDLGLTPGYAMVLPRSTTGVYSASIYPDDLTLQRVIHLDQYSGRALVDMSYADYGPLGRGLEWGINIHLGQEWGVFNQILMLMVCIAIIVMSVSGGVMWWKRRPQGSMGVPPLPRNRRTLYGVTVIMAIGGVIFPLVGASMIVVLVLDRLFAQRPRTVTRPA